MLLYEDVRKKKGERHARQEKTPLGAIYAEYEIGIELLFSFLSSNFVWLAVEQQPSISLSLPLSLPFLFGKSLTARAKD